METILMPFAISVGSLTAAVLLARFFISRSWGNVVFNETIQGRVVLVTGGTSGIGYEISNYLSSVGAHVVIASRDPTKLQQTVERICAQNNSNSKFVAPTPLSLDLNSLASVREAVRNFHAQYDRLHVLVNNAGVFNPPFQLSADGFETQMSVNHLGAALLTDLLLPTIEHSGTVEEPARIIMVSSTLYKYGEVLESFFQANAFNEQQYAHTKMYANSKLCSLLWARKIAADLRARSKPVSLNICSPGLVLTNLHRHDKFAMFKLIIGFIPVALFVRTPRQGARTPLNCAMNSPLSESGKFFRNCKVEKFEPIALEEALMERVYRLTKQAIKTAGYGRE